MRFCMEGGRGRERVASSGIHSREGNLGRIMRLSRRAVSQPAKVYPKARKSRGVMVEIGPPRNLESNIFQLIVAHYIPDVPL